MERKKYFVKMVVECVELVLVYAENEAEATKEAYDVLEKKYDKFSDAEVIDIDEWKKQGD